MGLFSRSFLFEHLGSITGAVTAATIFIIAAAIVLVMIVTNLNLFELIMQIVNVVLGAFSKFINKQETNYHRDLVIGKIDEKKRRVKIYRFLNDLTIDLGLKQKGATPYEFLAIVAIIVFMGTVIFCQLLFGSYAMVLLMFPIILAGTICTLYTRANVSHDKRIEDIIEAENIICNNISGGVLVAIKESIHVMPKSVQGEFRDFVDNVESKNYHIRTALLELNNNLGSVADDFIKKCIVLETEEEHGIVNMFRDVVEVNSIKMELRIEMKRRFEEVKQSFIIGAAMILVFLFGVLAVFEDVRSFYLKSVLGQLLLALDVLVLIIEFVYITYLRAQEL